LGPAQQVGQRQLQPGVELRLGLDQLQTAGQLDEQTPDRRRVNLPLALPQPGQLQVGRQQPRPVLQRAAVLLGTTLLLRTALLRTAVLFYGRGERGHVQRDVAQRRRVLQRPQLRDRALGRRQQLLRGRLVHLRLLHLLDRHRGRDLLGSLVLGGLVPGIRDHDHVPALDRHLPRQDQPRYLWPYRRDPPGPHPRGGLLLAPPPQTLQLF